MTKTQAVKGAFLEVCGMELYILEDRQDKQGQIDETFSFFSLLVLSWIVSPFLYLAGKNMSFSCWGCILIFLKTPTQIVGTLVSSFTFQVQGRISNSFLVFLPADGLYALSFSISSLTLIGMLAVITYTVSWDLRQLFNVASFVYLSFICTVINASFRRDYFQILLSKED